MSSFDRSGFTSQSSPPDGAPGWFVKLFALVLVLLCVAIGVAGLILPVIPGLLFLAFAMLIAARLFPPLGRRLRRSATFAPYMDRADHVARLSLQGKLKFALWFSVKIVWDSFVLALHYIGRFIAWLGKDSTRA